MDRTRSMGVAMGVIRAGVGGALVVAPRWSGRIWVGSGADGPGSVVFARALGARDVALGTATLVALRSERATAGMLRLGFMADVADAVATVIAAPHLEGRRRTTMPLIAGVVGAAGLMAAGWAEKAERQRSEHDDGIPTPAGEIRVKVKVADDVDLRAVDQARV
jgi:hypothetical protein